MRFSKDSEGLLNAAFMHTAGIDLNHVSSEIQARTAPYLEQQREISQAGTHPQAIAQRAGLHTMQALLFETGGSFDSMCEQAATAEPTPPPNWNLVSAIELLAIANITIAQALMPKKLREAAEEWQWVDAKRQMEICEELFEFLRNFHGAEEKNRKSLNEVDLSTLWCADYLQQGAERIFAKSFMKHEEIEPNCLGKAQILVAFFELAKAKIVGITPIVLSEDTVHSTLCGLSSAITGWAKENDIEISEKLLARFAQRERASEILERHPCRFHMAVAIELADESWFMIDPHMQVRGPLSNSVEIRFSSQLVDLFAPVLPGFCSMSAEGEGVQKATFSAAMAAGDMMDACKRIRGDWGKYDDNPQACIPLLAHSAVLEVLVEEGIGVPDGQQEDFRDFIAGEKFALFTMNRGSSGQQAVRFRTSTGRELSSKETMRMQVSMSILSMLGVSSEVELGQLDQPEIHAKGLRRVLSMLPSMAYKHAAKALGVTSTGGRLIHPVLEIYEPKFRIGVEQLAHLNAISASPSNKVVMELAALCGGQHHMALAATEALRSGAENNSTIAWAAIDVLQKSPALLPVAKDGLLQLTEEGLLTPTSTSQELAHV